jgi:hypothetical protein
VRHLGGMPHLPIARQSRAPPTPRFGAPKGPEMTVRKRIPLGENILCGTVRRGLHSSISR